MGWLMGWLGVNALPKIAFGNQKLANLFTLSNYKMLSNTCNTKTLP
jgi:hypothetical protein